MDTTETATAEVQEDQNTADEVQEAESKALKKLGRKIAAKRYAIAAGEFATNLMAAATLVCAVLAFIPVIFSMLLGYSFNTIMTGSMSGTANVGDVAVTSPTFGGEVSVDRIVLYVNNGERFLHRVVAVNDDGSYTTQGDANDEPDDFKSTKKDIKGVVVNILTQPQSLVVTAFSLTPEWADAFWPALFSGDFETVGKLAPSAPYGVPVVIAGALLFWWFIPDALSAYSARSRIKAELALEALKRAVAGHDESLTEIEPVIEEIRQEKAEKAEEFANAAAAQENLLASLTASDPETFWADQYDEDEVAPVPAGGPEPTLPNPFAAIIAQRGTIAPRPVDRSLGVFPAFNAQSPANTGQPARTQQSAFDLDQD